MVWLTALHILVSAALITAILLQNRSAGMSSAFGGGSEGFHVRRGSEKLIFQATIVLAALFILTSAAHLFV